MGLSVEFSGGIDLRVNDRAQRLFRHLLVKSIPGVMDLNPTYQSLLIQYHPLKCSFERLVLIVEESLKSPEEGRSRQAELVRLLWRCFRLSGPRRAGFRRHGHSGPKNPNILAGNRDAAAGVEVAWGGFCAAFLAPAQMAITGADPKSRLNGRSIPCWTGVSVRKGDILEMHFPETSVSKAL